jgi:acylpyruvate hydrolase
VPCARRQTDEEDVPVKLGKVASDDGGWIVAESGGRTYRTGFRSFGEALVGGAMRSVDRFAIEEIPALQDTSLLPVVDRSSKVICIGHNYRDHILEMGHPLPEYPNVFCKYPDSVVGPGDAIVLDPAARAWDWEAELAIVIGRPARKVAVEDAGRCIAGYTVANDISARDWQRRGTQWLLGKTFERTTPIGPWLVSAEDVDPAAGLEVTCSVNGVQKQSASTRDLVFAADVLVSYVSTVLTLHPGDVVLTGTPGGVGAARTPAERLEPGDVVTTSVSGVGEMRNACVDRAPA